MVYTKITGIKNQYKAINFWMFGVRYGMLDVTLKGATVIFQGYTTDGRVISVKLRLTLNKPDKQSPLTLLLFKV